MYHRATPDPPQSDGRDLTDPSPPPAGLKSNLVRADENIPGAGKDLRDQAAQEAFYGYNYIM